jgi:hypothetical protein
MMRPGETYRILNVRENTSFPDRPGFNVVIEYVNNVKNVDYQFAL